MNFRTLIALLGFCGSIAYSQGYYPLQVGNQWDYGEIDYHTPGGYVYDYSVRIIGDTTMQNGLTYAIKNGDFGPEFMRQSGPRVYAFLANTDSVLYDFTLQDGDTASFSKTDTFYTLVTVNVGQTQVFGRTLKAWGYSRTTNTSSDGGARYTIADSIGRTFIVIDGGYTDYLMGAIIDGKRYGTVTSVGAADGHQPSEFRLLQNYPNPFNPNTTIKYELPKASIVRLTVYDMLGRELSVLVNERREAGVHEVKFDASSLPSGVYFYRIQAIDFTQTKRLILLR